MTRQTDRLNLESLFYKHEEPHKWRNFQAEVMMHHKRNNL